MQRKKTLPKRLYQQNDFLVIKDKTAKDNFTLALAKKDVFEGDKQVNVVFMIRDKDKTPHDFVPTNDQKIDPQLILFKADDVQVFEPKDKTGDLSKRKDFQISLKRRVYNFIKSKVEEELAKEKPEEPSEDEEAEEDVSAGRESIELQKLKREEVLNKLVKSKRGKAPSRSVSNRRSKGDAEAVTPMSVDEDIEIVGEEPTKLRAESLQPGARGRRSKQSKSQSVTRVPKARRAVSADNSDPTVILPKKGKKAPKKPPKPQPTFKKGVFNLNVKTIPNSKQYEGTSDLPNTDCCTDCTNKEFVRAAKNNNKNLFDNLKKLKDQITSSTVPQGPKSAQYPMAIALKKGYYDMVYSILELEKESSNFAKKTRNFQFQIVQTGENDKYAYGVKTRQVEMARAGREGTNAFLYDNNFYYKSLSNAMNITQLCRLLRDKELYTRLLTLVSEIDHTVNYQFHQIVEQGNIDLAIMVAEKFVANNGFGFNNFHLLALTARTPNELNDMKVMNAKKKSIGNKQITPIHLACLNPNPDILAYFLQISPDPYITDEYGRKPLHYAALNQSTIGLQTLLDRGMDCREQDRFKSTPMMMAAIADRPENIRLMARHVVYDLNQKNRDGNAAIHLAVQNQSLGALKALLELGANQNLSGRNRMTPVMIACEIDCFEAVEMLVVSGAKIIAGDKFRKTALHHAAISGNLKTLTYLLSKGAEMNKADSSGNTSLHYACAYGHYEMIDVLVAAGANINAVNSWNLQPILVAMMKGHYRCVKILVEHQGIDVNCQDSNGNTLIMNCLLQFTQTSLNFCDFLIEKKGAKVNLSDSSGNNIIHKLAMKAVTRDLTGNDYKDSKTQYSEDRDLYKKFFELLTNKGIDLNQRNLKDFTPLEIAFSEENWTFVEFAIKNPGFDFVSPNSKGEVLMSKLGAALFYKHGLKLAEAVLDKQTDVKRLEYQFDQQGLNFFHQITLHFTNRSLNNPYNEYYMQKSNFYTNCKQKQMELRDQELYNKLDAKQRRLEKKRNEELIKSHMRFEELNILLYKKNFNFFVRVEVRLTPWSEWVAKSKEQALVNNAMGPRRVNKYRKIAYRPNTYNQPESPKELEDKSQWVDFVANDLAGCTLFHLLMVNPIERILLQMFEYAIKDGQYKPNELNHFGESVFLHMARNFKEPSEVPNTLLLHGEDPNIGDSNDNFPLLIVCKNNNQKCFEQFVKLGVKLDQQGADGETALIYFAKRRSINEAELLLTLGANPNTCDKLGRNAMHWSLNNNTQQDKNFEFEELLIKFRIELNKIDKRGRQPIHYLFVKIGDPLINAKKDPIEICADLFNSNGVEIDTPDNFGNTPLCYAAQRGAYLCFGALVKRRADINHVNKDGNCPLTIALLNDHPEVAVFCLQKGVNFNRPVFDVNNQAKIRFAQLKDELAKAMEINDGKNTRLIGIVRPGTVREQNVLSYIQARKDNAKLIADFGEPRQTEKQKPGPEQLRPFSHYAAPIVQAAEVTALHNKPATEMSITELRKLENINFLKRKLTIFSLAIQKGFDAVDYLLVDGGLNIGSAVIDTLESCLFKYTIKLLSKKNTANPNFLDQFNYQNDKNQTLAHIFAKSSAKVDEVTAETIVKLLLEKRVQINEPDMYGVTPLLYLAYHSKNIKMIRSLLEKGAISSVQDKGNNWLVSCFIQDNKLLRVGVDIDGSVKQQPSKGTRKKLPIMMRRAQTFAMHTPLNHVAYGNWNTANFGSANTGFGNSQAFTPTNFNTVSNRFESSFSGPNSSALQPNFNTPGSTAMNFASFSRAATIGGQPTLPAPVLVPEADESTAPVLPPPVQEAFDFIVQQLKAGQGIVNSRFDPFLDSKRGYIKPQKNSLLSYTLKKLKNLNLAQLLINNGANINSQDDKGYTVLTWAIRENQTEIVRFLVTFADQIDFNHLDKENKSYLHHIVSPMTFASFENVEFMDIVGRKVNVNRLDRYGRPAIYYAKLQASGRMLKKLKLMNAADLTPDIPLPPPHVSLSDQNFYENPYDFEEDHKKAVEEAEQLFKGKGIEPVQKPKPSQLIVGRTTLVNDPSGKPYDIKLIKVEIKYGHFSENVFYIMQIVFDETRRIYVLFTNWGRVGNDGQYQQTPFFKIEEAVKEFKKIFKEKTGNDYDAREEFVKKNGKYRIIQTQQRPVSRVMVNLFDANFIETIPPQIPSNLVELMKNLADQKLMSVVYDNMRLDPELMPFGNLSRNTIRDAKAILQEISAMTINLEQNQKNLTSKELFELWMEINFKASRYLELIPTVGNKQEQIPQFDRRRVNNERIRLNDMENLELVSRVLGAATYRIKWMYPYEYCLRSLGIKIQCLPDTHEEYELIRKYYKATSENSGLVLSNVYAVERKGEAEAFKLFEKHQNKRLLWHGTRTENVMGILQQGLRVAPSESERTGSRLGDGLYFSDMFRKAIQFSSNFGSFSSSQKVYALIVEVFLGKMLKVYKMDAVKELSSEYNSIKAQGRETPDKSQRVYLTSGTMIPIGKPVVKHERPPIQDENAYYQFTESEYCIFNKSQAKIRYLVEFSQKGEQGGAFLNESVDEDNIWSDD